MLKYKIIKKISIQRNYQGKKIIIKRIRIKLVGKKLKDDEIIKKTSKNHLK
jgi:hypothetical protein